MPKAVWRTSHCSPGSRSTPQHRPQELVQRGERKPHLRLDADGIPLRQPATRVQRWSASAVLPTPGPPPMFGRPQAGWPGGCRPLPPRDGGRSPPSGGGSRSVGRCGEALTMEAGPERIRCHLRRPVPRRRDLLTNRRRHCQQDRPFAVATAPKDRSVYYRGCSWRSSTWWCATG